MPHMLVWRENCSGLVAVFVSDATLIPCQGKQNINDGVQCWTTPNYAICRSRY